MGNYSYAGKQFAPVGILTTKLTTSEKMYTQTKQDAQLSQRDHAAG